MSWLAIHHHHRLTIHRLSTLIWRPQIKTWASSSACCISTHCSASYARHYHKQRAIPYAVDYSKKTFLASFPAVPLSQTVFPPISYLHQIHKLHQVNFSRSIHASSSTLSSANSSQITDSDFKEVIYRFPYIRVFRLINRLKIAQTIVVTLLVPGVFYLHHLKLVGLSTLISQSSFAVFAMVMLYAISYYMRRIVGLMFINESHDQLKIAHMDIWGKRCDEIIPVSNVVPFRDTGDKRGERFMHIKLYDSKQYYILDRKRGQFVNMEIFQDVFGEFS